MRNEGPEQPGSAISRRKFIVMASRGVAVGAVGVPLLLEACTPAAPSGATSTPAGSASTSAAAKPTAGAAAAPAAAGATGGGVKLPTFAPFAGPKPDLPGNAQGLDPAYYTFPSELIKTIP